MPVPAGLNEDTDAAVEPRGGPPLFLAGSITRTNEVSQKANPKGIRISILTWGSFFVRR